MSAKLRIKPRKCKICNLTLFHTAKGIKEHMKGHRKLNWDVNTYDGNRSVDNSHSITLAQLYL